MYSFFGTEIVEFMPLILSSIEFIVTVIYSFKSFIEWDAQNEYDTDTFAYGECLIHGSVLGNFHININNL